MLYELSYLARRFLCDLFLLPGYANSQGWLDSQAPHGYNDACDDADDENQAPYELGSDGSGSEKIHALSLISSRPRR